MSRKKEWFDQSKKSVNKGPEFEASSEDIEKVCRKIKEADFLGGGTVKVKVEDDLAVFRYRSENDKAKVKIPVRTIVPGKCEEDAGELLKLLEGYEKTPELLLKLGDKKRKTGLFLKRPWLAVLILIAAALLLELFVFNYKHWITFFLTPSNEKLYLSEAFIPQPDGSYLIGEGEQIVEVRDFRRKLSSLRVSYSVETGDEDRVFGVPLWVRAVDTSHSEYYGLGMRTVYNTEKRSEYMIVHPYGDVDSFCIEFSFSREFPVRFSVTANARVPLMFSIVRFLAVAAALCLLYAFRPGSVLYRIDYFGLPKKSLLLLLVFQFLFHAIVFHGITNVNPFFKSSQNESQAQYQNLAEALKEGSFALLIEPSPVLATMDNPYDKEYREKSFEGTGDWYRWDHAYYKGKYYVYFGVVPALVFYLPVYLLTGQHIENRSVIFITSILFLLGLTGTLHMLLKRYNRKISFGHYLLLSGNVLLGTNIVYMLKRPDLYTVPILSGLAFGFLGFWFFLMAKDGGKIRYSFIGIGSFFTALVAGCRPQLFLIFLFFFVIYGAAIIGKENLTLGNREQLAFELLLPMFAVAAFLMIYNLKRFGSPFDFGANYNLNFNDMRNRGWVWGRIPLGIFAGLFQPVKITQAFPFAERVYFDSKYLGITIQEATYGGLFMTTPFVWLSLPVLFRFRKYRGVNRQAAVLSLLGILIAFALIAFDTEGAGVLYRYFDDFSVFFMLSAFLNVCMIMKTQIYRDETFRNGLIAFLIFCFAARLLFEGMTFFVDTGESLQDMRPDLFAKAKAITAFWI